MANYQKLKEDYDKKFLKPKKAKSAYMIFL